MKIVSFLIAFVIFSIVILFHELGHFLLAKANGILRNRGIMQNRIPASSQTSDTKLPISLNRSST